MTINTEKLSKHLKKLPYYLALILLTSGASLILGFLSFSGMYTLFAALPLSCAAFVLSVAYECEIYLQNIKGTFKKLFKNNYLHNHLAKEYLLQNILKTSEEDLPEFFRDYQKQLKLLNAFRCNKQKLNTENEQCKKNIEKTLTDMEKWFASELFSTGKGSSEYSNKLRTWLAKNDQTTQDKLLKRQFTFKLLKIFSVFSGAFMGLGSTYLIMEAFTVIPWSATLSMSLWPIVIIPMAIIAGSAYGILTYNSMTDLINNDTLNAWYEKISKDLAKEITLSNLLVTTMALILLGLAVALTVCTAGTWWTIATNARPLFAWMKKLPLCIMGIINPLITGFSAVSFNIENTATSMEWVYNALHSNKSIYQEISEWLTKSWEKLRAEENWLQIINPFRLILKLIIIPLRILLFIGHLTSIALTADRMPGIPRKLSALIAFISEGFEDAHYFLGDWHHTDHEHDTHQPKKDQDIKTLLQERLGTRKCHNHSLDIPTRILQFLALPLYTAATSWHWLFGSGKNIPLPQNLTKKATEYPSFKWQVEHAVSLIEKYQAKHFKGLLFNQQQAHKKNQELSKLKENIRQAKTEKSLLSLCKEAKNKHLFHEHRLFSIGKNQKTSTGIFIETFGERVQPHGGKMNLVSYGKKE